MSSSSSVASSSLSSKPQHRTRSSHHNILAPAHGHACKLAIVIRFAVHRYLGPRPHACYCCFYRHRTVYYMLFICYCCITLCSCSSSFAHSSSRPYSLHVLTVLLSPCRFFLLAVGPRHPLTHPSIRSIPRTDHLSLTFPAFSIPTDLTSHDDFLRQCDLCLDRTT